MVLKKLFSSTASIYGDPNNQQVLESDPPNPLNPYADSKLKLKFIIQKSNEINIKFVILNILMLRVPMKNYVVV